MRRRDFLVQGVVSAGTLAAFGPSGAVAEAPGRELPEPIQRLQKREAPPPISEAERTQRRAKAQQVMASRNVAALFIEPGPSLSYFADVGWGRSERVFGMLLPQKGPAIIISPAFEKERAALGVRDRFEIRAWQEDESPYALIVKSVRDAGVQRGRIAVDPTARVFVLEGLGDAAGQSFEVAGGADVVNLTRGVKTAHEIEIMRFANLVTLEAFDAAFRTMRAGMTQDELAGNVSAAMTRLGYEGGALVLFGESSAYPHGAPSPRPLAQGDVVLVDGGLSVHGYASDDTRTVSFGSPSAEAQRAFDVVREAQQIALHTAAPGKRAGEVDAAARAYITKQGFGEGYKLFTHRVGHGIGLEGHEWPYLVKGSEIVLQPGMTFSDEPGIYQYGKFGMRLEDIMAITTSGAEMLTPAATKLRYDV